MQSNKLFNLQKIIDELRVFMQTSAELISEKSQSLVSSTQIFGESGSEDLELVRIGDTASKLIPPLWGLDSFVAVNPFWGLKDTVFLDAIREFRCVTNESGFASRRYFFEKYQSGEITGSDIEKALKSLSSAEKLTSQQFATVTLDSVIRFLTSPDDVNEQSGPTSILEFLDAKRGTKLFSLTHANLTKFLALYFDRGQAASPSALALLPLVSAWRKFIATDRELAFSGAGNLNRALRGNTGLNYGDILQALKSELGLSKKELGVVLATELFSCRGWAAYLQHLDFEDAKSGKKTKRVETLLGVKCAYTLAALQSTNLDLSGDEVKAWIASREQRKKNDSDLLLLVCQTALENRFRESLKQSFRFDNRGIERNRPKVQALFCIDVRSEGLRRSLESVSGEIETYGFAGFFGLPFGFTSAGAKSSDAQYPVLLQRTFDVKEVADADYPNRISFFDRIKHNLSLLVRILRQSVCSGFSYVEAFGVLYGAKMLGKTFANRSSAGGIGRRKKLLVGLTLEQKISSAAAIIKNSSLQQPLAPIVLLCGHRGCVTNNPYAAGLDCGACGGHAGESNARVAAQILNEVEVREGLKSLGINIPADTKFIAGIHLTTTEQIEIFTDGSESDFEKPLKELRGWAAAASALSRAQLAKSLGGVQHSKSLLPQMVKRSADWSELRAEWGLARNAGFIAAKRTRTRGVELLNRCFLHEYDCSADKDSSVLELIMTAPMIVASWINLQYYGSAVMPNTFGSGNKTIHNVVGQLGTVQGNGGDLGIGLPFQSVHSGKKLFHDPLRLQVVIEAPAEKIDAVIKKHNLLQEIIDNGWLSISALSVESNQLVTREGVGNWK